MVAPAGRPSGPSTYGATRRRSDGTKRTHAGVDLYAPAGTPITSPAAGMVRHAHKTYAEGFSGYGRVVVVRLDSGGEILVAHLDGINVARGQRVKRGDLLGTVGDTAFTRENPRARFESSEPHAHVEFLPRGSYPVPRGTPRGDPTGLAFYPELGQRVKPPKTELFATPGDASKRADQLLDRWNALQNQALGPGVKPRSDIPRWLQTAIVNDRKRYRTWIQKPLGLWGALVPQGMSESADYAQLKRWFAKYETRARQLASKLPPGEALAGRARPESLPRKTSVIENLESAALGAQALGYGVLILAGGVALLSLARSRSK